MRSAHATDDDAAIVRRVLDGDVDAYEALVLRHQDELFRTTRRMRIDDEVASDLVQDAFITAYQRLRECRDPARFRFYVLRILRNRCLDWLKNIRRRSVDLDVVPLQSSDPSALSELRRAELRSTIDSALAGLNHDLREAFLMKHHEERSYDEMAEICGASVSAMKMRVHRAREQLREALVDVTSESV